MWPKLDDGEPKEITWGWDSEKGKWVDWQGEGIKWWQRPGYLTPNGYRQPPHWNLRDYALCVEELKFAKIEADLCTVLKTIRGMTIEEIRAKASVYEFLEDPNQPKMTSKMMFLMQVKCLYDGKTDELVDLRNLGLKEQNNMWAQQPALTWEETSDEPSEQEVERTSA